MDCVVDWEPARDDGGCLAAEQGVDVDVHFPYGVVSTVCIVVQDCDLQWLILQVLIINLQGREEEDYLVGVDSFTKLISWVQHFQMLQTSNLNHSEFHCGFRHLG